MTERGASFFPFQKAFEQFWIAPNTNWQRFFNPQIFVSYNSADADIENHVLGRAGSYGKQIGRILDVLDVLVPRLAEGELTPSERLILDRFRDLSGRVDSAVDEFRGRREGSITLGEIDRIVERVKDLASTDAVTYRAVADRLRSALAPS